MSLDHQQVSQTLHRIISEAGLTFTEYNDDGQHTTYPLVGGKSIKFWNIFPRSGPKLDNALLRANQYLRPLGLFLACHNYTRPYNRMSAYSQQYVDIPRTIFSLLVKPLPESMK